MTTPTPFQRLLQEAGRRAAKDPQGAYAQLDELYGKTLTAEDVLQLGAFAVHLGVAVLGRFAETEAFQRRLLAHPATAPDPLVRRSLLRGLAVLLRVAGRSEDAAAAAAEGATDDAERCRLSVLTGQTLAARGRAREAAQLLREADPLLAALSGEEEIVKQAAPIGANLALAAEGRLREAQELLRAATATMVAATTKQAWRLRHRALFQQGRGELLCGDPGAALAAVNAMMALEDAHDAGPVERFFTAMLACRAQLVRGQRKIAAAAFEACRDFAARAEGDKLVQDSLAELQKQMEGR